MKLDVDLVRQILEKVEEFPLNGGFHDVVIEGRSEEEITFHVMLLDEAGFIEAEDLTTFDSVCWKPKRLTYSGHEFLNAARSDTVWQKAKAVSLKTTSTLTLEGLKSALPHVMKALIQAGGF
jgi:hypothetical protein